MTPGQRELDFGWEVWATGPSVPVLAHRLGQSEQSYLEKWPTGIKICLSRLQHGFATTRTWERICQHTGVPLGVWEVGQ